MCGTEKDENELRIKYLFMHFLIMNSPPGGRCCHKCAVVSVACAFSVQIFKDFYSAANQKTKNQNKKEVEQKLIN